MMLRTLLVSSPQAPVDPSAWSDVGPRLRAHAGFSLIGEALGEEAIGFASLSRPDLLIVAWNARSDALMEGLQAACPEARVLLVDGPEGKDGVTSLSKLDEALDRIVAEMTRKPPERPRTGKLIVVYSPKGGSGRSQLATNLAIALSRGTSRETIVLDAGMTHGEQDLFLNLQPPGFAAITTPHRLDAALATHPSGVKLMAPTASEAPPTPERLAQILGWLQQRDAWIVADTHPSQTEVNRTLLREADRVYVPLNLDLSHLRAIQRELASCREQGIDTSRFEFVAWGERSEVSREDAARTLKRPIDWSLPYDPGRVRAAINQGIPILQSDPRGALARELTRLVAAMGEPRQTMALMTLQPQPWHGFLNWLRRGPTPNGFGA
jgi:Flp pilus assembly CpaE family ATPase